MLLFGHRYEDAKLLQSHGVLLHQFDQREAEARDKQQRERTEPGRPKAPRRQEQPVETECYALLAQAAVPTMLWNAIPIAMDSIIGLNIAMPGSCLVANAAPAIIQFRNRPGRIS
jgi:hypothetical protein